MASPVIGGEERLKNVEVAFYRLSLPGELSLLKDSAAFWHLTRLIKKETPDIIHVHGYKAALSALPAAYLAGSPVLVTVHNYLAYPGVSRLPSGFFRRMAKALDPLVNRYITVSDALKRELVSLGISPGKISTVYNGIEPLQYRKKEMAPGGTVDGKEELKKMRGCRFAVGTLGRLVPQKGMDILVKAAAQVCRVLPGTRFFIAGEGPERESLESLASELNLNEKIVFLGKIQDTSSFLRNLDLFVLSSRSEGLSISLLEAGAAGVPVVAADSGGMPEVVRDGKTGLVVPPGDSSLLAEAVCSLLQAPAWRKEMGESAASHICAHFTEENMVRKTEEIYEAVINSANSGRGINNNAGSSV